MRALTLPVIEVIYTLIEIEKAVEGDMSFAISHMNQSVELIVWIWRRLEETPILYLCLRGSDGPTLSHIVPSQ